MWIRPQMGLGGTHLGVNFLNTDDVVVMANCYVLLKASKQTWMSLLPYSRITEYLYEQAAFCCADHPPNGPHR